MAQQQRHNPDKGVSRRQRSRKARGFKRPRAVVVAVVVVVVEGSACRVGSRKFAIWLLGHQIRCVLPHNTQQR
jgi:hypothetical protein